MTDEGVAPKAPKPTAMPAWEAQLGYGVAGVAAAGGVLQGISQHNTAVAGVAVGFGILLAFGAHHGHRVLAAVAGVPSVVLTRYVPIQLIVMGYLFLLVMRTSNAQSRLRRMQPSKSAADRRAETEARVAEKRARRQGVAPPSASKAPLASRRYTPPKAKTRRPTPPANRHSEERPEPSGTPPVRPRRLGRRGDHATHVEE